MYNCIMILQPTYSPMIFLGALLAACLLFGFVMMWIKDWDDRRAFERGRRAMLDDIINNGLGGMP